jgi:hypothetical protein
MKIPDNLAPKLQRAVTSDHHILLYDLIAQEDIPTWESFVHAMHAAAFRPNDNIESNPLKYRQIRDLTITGVMSTRAVLDEEENHVNFPSIMPFQSALQEIIPREHNLFTLAESQINFLREETKDIGNNNGNEHILYVQCHGTTEWTIYEDDEGREEIETKELNPGDAIFITSEVYYSTWAMTLTAGVVFKLQVDDVAH